MPPTLMGETLKLCAGGWAMKWRSPRSVDAQEERLDRCQERLGLFDVRHVTRLLEDHPLGAGNALVDLAHDERRLLVVAAGDQKGRRRDLVQPVGDVPR